MWCLNRRRVIVGTRKRLVKMQDQDWSDIRADRALGGVYSVKGGDLTALLEETPDGRSSAHLGELVRIEASLPGRMVFGIVTGLSRQSVVPGGGFAAVAQIQLVGETVSDGDGGIVLERGVSRHPVLGAPVRAADRKDLETVFVRPGEKTVPLGSLHQDPSIQAHVLVDGLLGKHFAIMGTTGAGKSCALALLLRRILTSLPNGHVVLIDPHAEYGAAFKDLAEIVTVDNLELPYWLLNFEELCGVVVSRDGAAAEQEQEILKKAVVQAKKRFCGAGEETDHITVDTPTPYRLREVAALINESMGLLDKAEGTKPFLRLISRLEALESDKRYGFMFSGLVVRDNLGEILSRLLRIPVSGKPMTVFDISGVPSEIVDVVVSVLSRTVFDFALWTQEDRRIPILFVCEEAHRYVPCGDDDVFGPTKRSIGRIAKEGRKYGVSLGLVSQRPSELSVPILSQCNTLFAMRMGNERDLAFVYNAMPEGSEDLFAALPALKTGEAVAIGEGLPVPMRMRFDRLSENRCPSSDTAAFSKHWSDDLDPGALIEETVQRWRYMERGKNAVPKPRKDPLASVPDFIRN